MYRSRISTSFLLTAAVGVVAALAGCGGGGQSGNTGSAAAAGQPATVSIRRNWSLFFDGSSPAATKVALLQDGQQYKRLIDAEAQSPIASQTKANVSRVTLISPRKARVTYTILVAGRPALRNRTGTAVKIGNSWKVSDQSFCQLLSLQGTAPSACPKA